MSQPDFGLPPEQAAQERAAQQVSDVLMQLDWTLDQAKKGVKIVAKDAVDMNAELALNDLIKELTKLRKRFVQDTYFAVDDRLI